jgi:glutathione S-transferase
MVLKLYSRTSATVAGSVIVAMVLAEKQIPFEFVLVDVANRAHKTPEYLAMNPFGQVPLIVSDQAFVSKSVLPYQLRALAG